jgi:hypothetical protein
MQTTRGNKLARLTQLALALSLSALVVACQPAGPARGPALHPSPPPTATYRLVNGVVYGTSCRPLAKFWPESPYVKVGTCADAWYVHRGRKLLVYGVQARIHLRNVNRWGHWRIALNPGFRPIVSPNKHYEVVTNHGAPSTTWLAIPVTVNRLLPHRVKVCVAFYYYPHDQQRSVCLPLLWPIPK